MQESRIVKLFADPGFGFLLVSTLYYAGTNAIGFAFATVALLVIGFIKFHPAEKGWRADPRTPLRIAGACNLSVALTIAVTAMVGTAAASTPAPAALQPNPLLPFCSAICFGTANILFASQIARDPLNAPPLPLHANPETYIFFGYIAVGLMCGLSSLYAMPLVLAGFVITVINCKNKKPLCHNHPLLVYACAEAGFAASAIVDGNGPVAVACFLCMAYLVRLDSLLTPDGLRAAFSFKKA